MLKTTRARRSARQIMVIVGLAGALVACARDGIESGDQAAGEGGGPAGDSSPAGRAGGGAAAIAEGRIVVKSGLQYAYGPGTISNNQIICYGLPE